MLTILIKKDVTCIHCERQLRHSHCFLLSKRVKPHRISRIYKEFSYCNAKTERNKNSVNKNTRYENLDAIRLKVLLEQHGKQ